MDFLSRKNCAEYYWLQGFFNIFSHLNLNRAENQFLFQFNICEALGMIKVQVETWFAKYKEGATDLCLIDLPFHLWNLYVTGCKNIHTTSEVVGNVGHSSYNIKLQHS